MLLIPKELTPNRLWAPRILVSGAFSIESISKKNELQKSIEEVREGKYFVAKNAKDAIAKCLT